MRWSRISPVGNMKCASANCLSSARWHGEAGDTGSYWCSTCRDSIDEAELRDAAKSVVSFDWSDSDTDAAAAIDRLRQAVNN